MFNVSKFLVLILIVLQTFSSVAFSESLPGKLADDFNDAARRWSREADDAAVSTARRLEAIEAQKLDDLAQKAIAGEARAFREAQEDINQILRKEQAASDLALKEQRLADEALDNERRAAQEYQKEQLAHQRRMEEQTAKEVDDIFEQARLARESEDAIEQSKKADLYAHLEQKKLDEEQFLKRKQDDIDAFEKKQTDIDTHLEKKKLDEEQFLTRQHEEAKAFEQKQVELNAHLETKKLDEEQFLKRKQDDVDAFEKKQADIDAHFEKKLEEDKYLRQKEEELVDAQVAREEITDTQIQSSKQYDDLKKHYKQWEKYGEESIKELESGKIRYYRKVVPPDTVGEMSGRRLVREWDPSTGEKRTWHETLDHDGNIRQVRPQLDNGEKTHYTFDKDGNYEGKW